MLGLFRITKLRIFALLAALLGTGFIGSQYDMSDAEAFFGRARRVERRQARRAHRQAAFGYGHYASSGSSGAYGGYHSSGSSGRSGSYGSYTGSGSSGSYGSYSNSGSAGGSGAVYQTQYQYNDCPNCGTVE